VPGILLNWSARLCFEGQTDRAAIPARQGSLDLCETAIHKQFRSHDVTTIVGCEKHDGLRDLIECTEPVERTLSEIIFKHCRPFRRKPPGRSVRDVADFLPSPPARGEAPHVRVHVPPGANRPEHGMVVRRVRDRFRTRDV
jgi:hypothetical protein